MWKWASVAFTSLPALPELGWDCLCLPLQYWSVFSFAHSWCSLFALCKWCCHQDSEKSYTGLSWISNRDKTPTVNINMICVNDSLAGTENVLTLGEKRNVQIYNHHNVKHRYIAELHALFHPKAPWTTYLKAKVFVALQTYGEKNE